ncbi:amidohydrolase family protein [Pseudodonghicola flavimaris]|uniref:Amidohydrolase family protein n=1 Tax=Pseudodonghicola flavimaris TaxID=3050036 RepID=A0ABT7F352_9RHOB|nr:amidohydrolase family protein [Pseudodonghicola flavimaris]MDK3019038.1 amidohydrolase family protein [Pseudodonghicola flavimaris]
MSPIRIVNCHIHTFTSDHVPRDFPYRWLRPFRRAPHLIRGLARLAGWMGRERLADRLERLYQFQQQGARATQADILADVKRHYPANTRFVVLPMDMANTGYGPVPVGLKDQHDELYRLRQSDAHLGTVIPFAKVNPLAPGSVDEALRAITHLGFEGLKLYPRLGYPPDHPDLMERVYPEVVARGLPVMTHCSRGGVQGRMVEDYKADLYTRPEAYLPVLHAFPQMRLCLAHFGGQKDWQAYADGTEPSGAANWQVQIRRMIGSGAFPNLWTDISYTLFHFDDYIPFLQLFLNGRDPASKRLQDRVLFGSDFYMTRQERLSEKAVCFRLRNALGEPLFRRIAEENPRRWLEGPSV